MGVSRKIEGCFNGILCGFQRCLEVQCFFRRVSKVFQGCLKEILRVLKDRMRSVLRDLQGNVKGI